MSRSGSNFRGALLREEYKVFGGLPPFCQFSLKGLDISVGPTRVSTFSMFKALAGSWLTAHHIEPLEVGGESILKNGVLLDREVHNTIHRLARWNSEVVSVTQQRAASYFRLKYHEYEGLFLPDMDDLFVNIWYNLLARKGLLLHEKDHYILFRRYF